MIGAVDESRPQADVWLCPEPDAAEPPLLLLLWYSSVEAAGL